MNEPDTLQQMNTQIRDAFRAKGSELAAHGWQPNDEGHADLMAKAIFHGQLRALLAGAASGRGARDGYIHGPN